MSTVLTVFQTDSLTEEVISKLLNIATFEFDGL